MCLQEQLEGTWLTLGVDDLIHALSHGPSDTEAGGTIHFGPEGSISVGERFRKASEAWNQGLAAIASAGIGVIVDDVFLDGGNSQARLQNALRRLAVIWVGVRCDPDIAEARELHRPDRFQGIARDQAERVHRGVRYDIVVDTTTTSSADCASKITERITNCGP
jgi:chloramphenicol 3-O phosphotransferase